MADPGGTGWMCSIWTFCQSRSCSESEQLEGQWNPLVLGQVEEHVWKPPLLIPSEEESSEVPFPTQGVSPTAQPQECRAWSWPCQQAPQLLLRARAPRERLGYPGAAGFGASDCVCECAGMDT